MMQSLDGSCAYCRKLASALLSATVYYMVLLNCVMLLILSASQKEKRGSGNEIRYPPPIKPRASDLPRKHVITKSMTIPRRR